MYKAADTEVFVWVRATRPLILQVPPCLRVILESPFLLYYQAGIVSMVEKDRFFFRVHVQNCVCT